MQGDLTRHLVQLRFRTLTVTLWFQTIMVACGAVAAYWLPVRNDFEWAIFAAAALASLMLFPSIHRARRAGDWDRVAWIGAMLVGVGAVLVVQRVAWAMLVSLNDFGNLSVFRPIFGFLPFVLLAAVALLPARIGLRLCWLIWALVSVFTVTGLLSHEQVSWHRDGLLLLLVWLFAGCPLFILLLHTLPNYEGWLNLAESEMRQLREKSGLLDRISESEQRFNLVVDSLQVGVWDYRFSSEGRITDRWWSPRFFELLGYQPQEMMANEDNANIILGSEAQAARLTMLNSLRATGRAQFDVRMHTRQRGLRWFNVSATAERDASGRVLRATGSIEDIHARRMAELELREAQGELVALAYRDSLTALPNRRAFDEQLQREWDRARRNGLPLSLMSIDIDWFKAYNDSYGHPAGDQCLRQVAEVINECLRRPGDFAARVGGEEFQVVMPETDAAGAMRVAELLEATLRERALPHSGSPLQRVTCSIGVATQKVTTLTGIDALISRADQGLYESKRNGRSRVTGEAAPPR